MRPFVPSRSLGRLAAAALTTVLAALVPGRLAAQQSQFDVHGDYALGTTTHLKSWGAGVGAQVTFGSTSDPVQLSLSPSVDYLKQEQSGPSQTSASVDLDVQPGGGSTVTPYVGVSAGANWSGGTNSQWQGAKLGLETLAGAQVKLRPTLSLKAEERFGYVSGQEHTLTTRAGLLLSF